MYENDSLNSIPNIPNISIWKDKKYRTYGEGEGISIYIPVN